MNKYHKSVIYVLTLTLLGSFAINLFMIYKNWQREADSVLMLANAQVEYSRGDGEKAIRYAYQAFIDEANNSSSARLIGDIYYCHGDIGAAIINYSISSQLTDSAGLKSLMQKNIESLADGKGRGGKLPNCTGFPSRRE